MSSSPYRGANHRRGLGRGRPSSTGGPETGSVSVEMVVFVVPISVLLLMIIVVCARAASASIDVQAASAAGARAAAGAASPGAAQAAARAAVASSTATSRRCTVAVDTGAFRPGGQVTVRVECAISVRDLGVPGLRSVRILHGVATEPVDAYREVS